MQLWTRVRFYQTVLALKSETPVYAAIAPSFVRQFWCYVTPEMVRAALKVLGFEDMVEVAIGADLCSLQEAEDFLENVPANQKWMGTSCCPAWSVMAKKTLPEYAHYISMSLTPMVLTARMIKKQHPECKVVFIGPCAAKKLEASRHSVRSDVDFVLTLRKLWVCLRQRAFPLMISSRRAASSCKWRRKKLCCCRWCSNLC